MATAPKACTTSADSTTASRPRPGAIRMPVTAVKALLMIQEMTGTRAGLAPVWASRSGAAEPPGKPFESDTGKGTEPGHDEQRGHRPGQPPGDMQGEEQVGRRRRQS